MRRLLAAALLLASSCQSARDLAPRARWKFEDGGRAVACYTQGGGEVRARAQDGPQTCRWRCAYVAGHAGLHSVTAEFVVDFQQHFREPDVTVAGCWR